MLNIISVITSSTFYCVFIQYNQYLTLSVSPDLNWITTKQQPSLLKYFIQQGRSLSDWCQTGWPHNTLLSYNISQMWCDFCLCNRHFPALASLFSMSPHPRLIHLRHKSSENVSLDCWCSHAGLWIPLNGVCVWDVEAGVSFVFLDSHRSDMEI